MKTIAVITELCARFRAYKSGQIAISENHNFIHVSNTESLSGNIFNDYVSLTTKYKMLDYDRIITEIKSRTVNLN